MVRRLAPPLHRSLCCISVGRLGIDGQRSTKKHSKHAASGRLHDLQMPTEANMQQWLPCIPSLLCKDSVIGLLSSVDCG